MSKRDAEVVMRTAIKLKAQMKRCRLGDLQNPDAAVRLLSALEAYVSDLVMDLTKRERELADSDRKIEAIKAVRERTALGLADAKERVEKYRARREP